ncbi:MAG: hypothetical protein M3071_03270 [Actinomycetota bacterium]|nr:hypothetical protein [Actinomycetota bacterium]
MTIPRTGDRPRDLACAASAGEVGATRVETAVLRLGGPVVRLRGVDPAGNLATEAVAATFAQLGLDTNLDPGRIRDAGQDVSVILGVAPPADIPTCANVRALITERSLSP